MSDTVIVTLACIIYMLATAPGSPTKCSRSFYVVKNIIKPSALTVDCCLLQLSVFNH